MANARNNKNKQTITGGIHSYAKCTIALGNRHLLVLLNLVHVGVRGQSGYMVVWQLSTIIG